jgi:hypothetical protein
MRSMLVAGMGAPVVLLDLVASAVLVVLVASR